MAARSDLIRGAALLLAAASLACAGLQAGRGAPPSRVSELASLGDPRHRASQRLVVEGLEFDARGDAARARSRYERALVVDASNPWAYLALARHHVEAGDGRAALSHLDQAEALFEAQEPASSPGARGAVPTSGSLAHRIGLRGEALARVGRVAESRALLERAARLAPGVWGDGHLAADELR